MAKGIKEADKGFSGTPRAKSDSEQSPRPITAVHTESVSSMM